jgi:hypothetical protein
MPSVTAAPLIQMALEFDAGNAAGCYQPARAQGMTMGLIEEG